MGKLKSIDGEEPKMYCYHCGKKLEHPVKVCVYCQKGISDSTDVLIENIFNELEQYTPVLRPDPKREFRIGYQSVVIDDEIHALCTVRKFVLTLQENTCDSMLSYIHYMSLKNLVEVGERKVKKMLKNISYSIFTFLKKNKIHINHTMKKEIFAMEELSAAIWEPIYEVGSLFDGIHSIAVQRRKAMQRPRTRTSTWVGGGFGFTGAIKGKIKADIMNVGADVLNFAGNMIRRGIQAGFDNYQERKAQEEVKETEELLNAILNSWSEIFEAIMEFLMKECLKDSSNWESNLEKIQNNNISFKTLSEEDAVISLRQNPFDRNAYLNLYCFNENYGKELYALAEECGIEKDIGRLFAGHRDQAVFEKDSRIFAAVGVDTELERLEEIHNRLLQIKNCNPIYGNKSTLKLVNQFQEYQRHVEELLVMKKIIKYEDVVNQAFASSNKLQELSRLLEMGDTVLNNLLFKSFRNEIKTIGKEKFLKRNENIMYPLLLDVVLIYEADKQETQDAFEKVLVAAEAGRPHPMEYCGVKYYTGNKFLKKEEEKGMNLIERAAKGNCSLAMAYLGGFYKKGTGRFHCNKTLASMYLKIAAMYGEAYAKNQLE